MNPTSNFFFGKERQTSKPQGKKKPESRLILILGISFLFLSRLPAQDFSNLRSKKAFQMAGSIGAQASSRLSDWNSIQDPLAYSIQIQLNPVLYGFSLPFSWETSIIKPT